MLDDSDPVDAPRGLRPATSHPDRFQAIVADADEGIIVLEGRSVIAYVNSAAEFLLGRTQSELAGEIFGFPLAPCEEPTLINVIARDDSLRLVELRVERLAPTPQEALVVRLKDVTDYGRRVADAEDQIKRRDEFLAMLSHELRNPIAAIQNSARLLGQGELTKQYRQEANAILERQFAHLARILDDLLDISRISRGTVSISLAPVDLIEVVHDAIEAATPLITARNHAFEIELPAAPLWVRGDATRLEQIVVNLLNNAAKFTPEGGNVRVTVKAAEDDVELTVVDDGPGIPQNLRTYMFESFVQGEQTLDRREGGLGLGLSLVRTFTLLHNGVIEVDAGDKGRGAAFTVRLPLLHAQEISSEAPVTPARPKLRILLIEDNADARRSLKYLLQLNGQEIIEADSGTKGLELLLSEAVDVALIDIGLPGMSGYEVVRRFREQVSERRPRLLALTGYGRPEDMEAATAAGFDGHLVKPVCLDQLNEYLSDCSVQDRD